MTWVISETSDIAACHDLRRDVFIEEQGVPENEEVDGQDGNAIHVLAKIDGLNVGTARVLIHGTKAKIGRVCVLPEQRGNGLGAAIVTAAVDIAQERNASEAILGAQLPALGFYAALGFREYGAVFDDAGIDHKMMRKPL